MASELVDSKSISEKVNTRNSALVSSEKSEHYGYSSFNSSVVPSPLVIQRTAAVASKNSRIFFGVSGTLLANEAESMKYSRNAEKRDMQDLNLRLANYIEQVRFLKAQNSEFESEIKSLRVKIGKESFQAKGAFLEEMERIRSDKDNAEAARAELEIKNFSLFEQLQEAKKRNVGIEDQVDAYTEETETITEKCAQLEAENEVLRKRIAYLEKRRENDKESIESWKNAVSSFRNDLDKYTVLYIDAENRRKSSEEELDFLKRIQEQEIKEMTVATLKEGVRKNRDFWKSEMEKALQEIQEVYDEKLESLRNETEASFHMRIQEMKASLQRDDYVVKSAKDISAKYKQELIELREKFNHSENLSLQMRDNLEATLSEKDAELKETKALNEKLKTEVVRLKAALESCWIEVDKIKSHKDGLELEISAYRKLLESAENSKELRSKAKLVHFIKTFTGDERGFIKELTKESRSLYNGDVSIVECCPNGKFVKIMNEGRKDEHLGGHTIERAGVGAEEAKFTFKKNVVLGPGKTITVWAKGCKNPMDAEGALEADFSNWGVGGNLITTIYDALGEEVAKHGLSTDECLD